MSSFRRTTIPSTKAQRTQLYGNLWLNAYEPKGAPNWEDFVIRQASAPARTPKEAIKALLPAQALHLMKRAVRTKTTADANVISDRLNQN
ncbi:MAG: hypothetical protein JO303_15480 [Caulobacteraceae bacterium]|nr:hypothetical protein [Caulobacteraceae bacterium]